MRNEFVNLVENIIKENEKNNIESLYNYLKSMLEFQLKPEVARILTSSSFTLNRMQEFAKSKGFSDGDDVSDANLAEFNQAFRDHVGLPQLFGDAIVDEEQEDENVDNEEGSEEDFGNEEGGDDLGGLEGEEGDKEKLEDDVNYDETLVAPEQAPMPTTSEEQPDLEGRLVKRQMMQTCEYARELIDMIADDEQLPGWVQAKMTKVADYIGAVKHYLEAEKELKQ